MVIDPNVSQLVTRTMRITSNEVIFNDGSDKVLTKLSYSTKSSIDFWDNFDIDGIYNDFSSVSSKSANTADNSTLDVSVGNYDDTALIMVPFAIFEIENAKGERLICDGATISGDMEILESWSSPDGLDMPERLCIRVSTSEWFKFSTTSENKTYFYVTAAQYYGGVSGDNICAIKVSSDGTIQIAGNDASYRVMSQMNADSKYYYLICGNGGNNLVLQSLDDQIKASGLTGRNTIKFYRNDGAETTEREITLNGQATAIDLSIAESSVAIDVSKTNQLATMEWVE